MVIRFWKLLRSLFLKNISTISCKRGFRVRFIEVKRAYGNEVLKWGLVWMFFKYKNMGEKGHMVMRF